MARYLELEVSLQHIKPRIWRRFLLHEAASFGDLNDAIQDALGWHHAHLWAFSQGRSGQVADTEAPDAPVTSVLSAPGRACSYTYDFGDEWVHEVKLRQFVVDDTEKPVLRRLLDGARACPPEDCGGLPGYDEACAVALGRSRNPDLKEWLGGWRPEAFDLARAKRSFDGRSPPSAPKAAVPASGKKKAPARGRGAGKAPKPPEAVDLQAAAETIDALLDSAVPDAEAVTEVLARLHPAAAEQHLLARLREGLPPGREWVAGLALSALQGETMSAALHALVLDETQELTARAVAFAVVSPHLDELSDEDAERLEDVLAAATFLTTRDSLVMELAADQGGSVVVEFLSQLDDADEVEAFLDTADTICQMEHISALAVYSPALAFPDLAPWHPQLLARLAAEDNPISRLWLALRRLPVPLHAVETPVLEELPQVEPQVWVTASTLFGSFSVIASTPDLYGTLTAAFVEVDPLDGLSTGGVSVRTSPDDIEALREDLAPLACHVATTPALATALLTEALARFAPEDLDGEEGEELEELIGHAALVCSLLGRPQPVGVTLPPAAEAVDAAALAALLETPLYEDWYLYEDSLPSLNLKPPPKSAAALKRWSDNAIQALQGDPELCECMAAAAAHMALLHHLRGEAEAAALMLAVSREVETSDRPGALVVAVVQRTPAAIKASKGPVYGFNPLTGQKILISP